MQKSHILIILVLSSGANWGASSATAKAAEVRGDGGEENGGVQKQRRAKKELG